MAEFARGGLIKSSHPSQPLCPRISRVQRMKPFVSHTASGLLLSVCIAACAPRTWSPVDEFRISAGPSAKPRSIAPPNTNLSMSPWPDSPYGVPLTDDFDLDVYAATSYTQRPLPALLSIQDFIRDFADNLERAFPPPAFAPKKAGQSLYDTESFTKWQIAEYLLPVTSWKAPTNVVVAALAQLSVEVARHGPPAEVRAIIVGRKRPGAKKNSPFNGLGLRIDPLGPSQLGRKKADGDGFSAISS